MKNDPLLQPYTLKHLRFKNRLMLSSHEPAYCDDGMPKARYRAYHEERARAGIALTMTAGSASVSRDSPPVFNNLLVWKDEIVPWMRELTDACHEHDCKVMIQLSHLGRRTRWDKGDWLPVVTASHEREASHKAFPKRMEDWDIARIIQDYVDAAERMHAAGLDGLEIMAYGHLLDQVWSPLTNDLDGPYGGSLDNRLRMTFDILRGIRARVGDDFVLGVRYTGDEALPGGLNKDDGLAISQRLKESGLVDFLNVVRGHIDTDAGLTDVIPVQGMPSAPHLDFAGEIKASTNFPTFQAAKIQDVATARHAIASGKLDMVGMTRAHLADPHIVAKILAGEEERIRPCVGANYCLDRIYQGGMALCIHNPSSGRELELPHTITLAERRRRILVVGAGPAGLEAARVAAARGHEVIVHEAAADPGGQVLLTAQTKRRQEMIQLVQWRYDECLRMGVTFHFNSYAEADTVLTADPQVVIVATGGLPHTELLPIGNELLVSSWDIITGAVKPGNRVLIYDDAGDYAGLQAAETLASHGSQVEVVCRDRHIFTEVMAMSLTPSLRLQQQHDVTFTPTWTLQSVARGEGGLQVVLGSDYGSATRERLVDQVVVNHGTRPLDEVYFELREHAINGGEVNYEDLVAGRPQSVVRHSDGSFQLFRIGDAVAARNTHAAILDALRLVRVL